MSKLAQEKEEVKALIRSLLTSTKEVMSVHSVQRDFKNMAGFELPYKKFGFYSCEAFLKSIPDTVRLQPSGGPSCNVFLVSSEKSKHIDQLVQRQKISTKKRGPRKLVRHSSVSPAMTTIPGLMPSTTRKHFIHQSLQKRISGYVAENPTLQAYGGPGGNVPMTSRPINDSMQQQGPRKPVPGIAVTPAMTLAPELISSVSKRSIGHQSLQSISDYLAEHATGVELKQMEEHLWIFKLEQFGGLESLLKQLPHIVKVEGGKAYPVNVEASKVNVPPPEIKTTRLSNVLPAGYMDDNSAQRYDGEKSDYSCSSDEEPVTVTKLLNEQVTAKQPAAQNVKESAWKQPIANEVELPYKRHTVNNFDVHEPAQSTANSVSELAFRQSTVNSSSEHAYRSHIPSDSCFHEPGHRQSLANRFSEPVYRPHTINNFTEPTFRQETRNSISEPVNRQPKVKHLTDPDAFSTFVPLSSSEIPKMRETTSASHISEKMKKNLQILAEKYPDGIWCSELSELYREHFGVDLNVQNLGFVTVVQFVADIPEVFHSVQASEADWMICDARKKIPQHIVDHKARVKHIPIPEHVKRNLKKLTLRFESGIAGDKFAQEYLDTFGKPLDVQEWGFDTVGSFLLSLQNSVLVVHYIGHQMIIHPKPGVEEEVAMPPVIFSDVEQYLLDHYPAEVVGPNFMLQQQDLPPHLKFCDNLEVLIAEVFTPSKFWLQLRGRDTTAALDKMMTEMQEFYNTEYHNELYKMREPTYRPLQHCVAPYSDEYHRAVITRVFTDEVQVRFVDYGTIGNVKKQTLRFLHNDYSLLPAQAIRARLANLQPVEGPDTPWPIHTCQYFLSLVAEKPLIAIVHTVDYQTKILEVALVDTNGAEDVHINDTLKKEGYAEYCRKKKDSPTKKETPKQNRQVATAGTENLESSSNQTEVLARKSATAGSQNANEGSYATPSTSSQTKKSDDEEPIIISAERSRVLPPPPGFSNRPSCSLPSFNPLTLMNMALCSQVVKQQQQVFQGLVASHPGYFMQGNPSLGTTFVTPYGTPYGTTSAFPVMNYPVAPLMMPNIAQVPVGHTTVINTVMPNVTQIPPANTTMINTVVPNITQIPPTNTTIVMPNVTQVPANTNTVDSATMTTFEEDSISELIENFNISIQENKNVTHCTPEMNTKLLNNIPVQEEDFDEDFIFKSDSEGEEPDQSNKFQEGSKQDSIMEHNYENVNVRQPQSSPQHRESVIIRQPYAAMLNKEHLAVKVVEISNHRVHIVNIRGEPHMCTDELVHVFTNFSGRHVVLKVLEAKRIVIPFKEIMDNENPKIFKILKSCEVQGVQKPFGSIPRKLHMIPLTHVAQLLRLLKIDDRKILQGVQATLESCTGNRRFWVEQ